jgi:hypothetical protein
MLLVPATNSLTIGDRDGKGSSGPRNPTSAPPAVQNGGVAPDSDIPF